MDVPFDPESIRAFGGYKLPMWIIGTTAVPYTAPIDPAAKYDWIFFKVD